MSTKAELQQRIDKLERELELAGQDYDVAIDSLDKLQRSFILVTFTKDFAVLDRVLIPLTSSVHTEVTSDLLDPNETIVMETKLL